MARMSLSPATNGLLISAGSRPNRLNINGNIEAARVRVNGEKAKPHRSLRIGDVVEVQVGDWNRVLVVKLLRDRPVAKAAAAELYEDRSPPRPTRDPIERAAIQRHARRAIVAATSILCRRT